MEHISRFGFFLCSAYRYCINDVIGTSYLRIEEKCDLIWKIKTFLWVKKFLWRLCGNCVPTIMQSIDKGVDCSSHGGCLWERG